MADNPLTEPEAFRRWLENPLTQAFRQFLKDRQLQLAMLWAAGSPLSPADQSQAETLGDLASLNCNDVRGFYGKDDVELIG